MYTSSSVRTRSSLPGDSTFDSGYVSLKSILTVEGERQGSIRRRQKRRAPLPPTLTDNRKTADPNPLRIVEDNQLWDGSGSKELDNIARCYNNLKIEYQKNKNPFEEAYDERLNPFAENDEVFDDSNPFKTDAVVEKKEDSDSWSLKLPEERRTSKIPVRRGSVNTTEEESEFKRTVKERRSMRMEPDTPKDPHLSRTISEHHQDPLAQLKKPWERVSAKFRKDNLHIPTRATVKSPIRPAVYKQVRYRSFPCTIMKTVLVGGISMGGE
ncbi:UNVERIFIED_CONTAM: hypothetical protein PYX00_006736 [Menopon gallinae]|uniref:Uncharacterized protein n=1 Tax=Menopon gallinae TaxID=328185 RepID=A0AAW2HY65_9NEOP